MYHFFILILFAFLFIANGYSADQCHESLGDESVDFEQNHDQDTQEIQAQSLLITNLQMKSRYVDHTLKINGKHTGNGVFVTEIIEERTNSKYNNKFKPTLSSYDPYTELFEFVDVRISSDKRLTNEYIKNHINSLDHDFGLDPLSSMEIGARFSEDGNVYFFDIKSKEILYHDDTNFVVNENPFYFNPTTRFTETKLFDKDFLSHSFNDVNFQLTLDSNGSPEFNMSSINIKPASSVDFKISTYSKWHNTIVDEVLVKTYLLESLHLNRYFHGFNKRVDPMILFGGQDSIELTLRITEFGVVYLIGNYLENNIVLMEDLSYSNYELPKTEIKTTEYLPADETEEKLITTETTEEVNDDGFVVKTVVTTTQVTTKTRSVVTTYKVPNLKNPTPVIVPTVQYLVTNTTDNTQEHPVEFTSISTRNPEFDNYSYVPGMETESLDLFYNPYRLAKLLRTQYGIDVNNPPNDFNNYDDFAEELYEAYLSLEDQ